MDSNGEVIKQIMENKIKKANYNEKYDWVRVDGKL